jgi:hypothetical protein
MWFQCTLAIREVVWLLEEMDMNRTYRSLVSSDSRFAVDMVKNWTEEDYIFPEHWNWIPWVVKSIEGAPSWFFDEASLSDLAVDVGPSSD